MPRGRGWYVKGRKVAFPHADALVAGPFDEQAEAYRERDYLRPLYPDATLSVALEVGALPERLPRALYDLSRVQGRRDAAAALAEFCRAFGAQVKVEDWDGEPDVDVTLPTVRANIWLAWHKEAPVPLVSWHRAERPLVGYLPGAWRQEGTYRNGKATSVPATWRGLFDALEIGLCAAIDGAAFDKE